MADKITSLLVKEQDLGLALQQLHEFMVNNSLFEFEARYNEIESNYALMKDFMQKGYKDPQRDLLYLSLLQKSYALYFDFVLCVKQRTNSGLSYYSRTSVSVNSVDTIKLRLEGFVQELAMLSLDGFEEKIQSKIYQEHHEFITVLFYQLMTSAHWDVQTRELYIDLLLSPTIDNLDAQLMVSAITLSLLLMFDVEKFLLLLEVYRSSLDEKIKQRALVGWVMALPIEEGNLFPQVKEQIDTLLQTTEVKQDLLELQIQLIYCIDAEKDTAEIQKEIIPNLMKGHNLNIINEMGEESIEDILNPESSEQAMESLEKSYHKMQEMHQKGSDIYFGGFSQMKRFPFFNRISNWFCPFYPNHPELTPIAGMEGNGFIQNLFKKGPFCNSDKYSFALAMSTIIQQIPSNIREMMGNDAVFMTQDIASEQNKGAYVRRIYLQDVYRFFKVSPLRSQFQDPFNSERENQRGFFFLNKIFKEASLENEVKELARFLWRKRKYSWMKRLFIQFGCANDVESLALQARSALYNKDYYRAQTLYEKVLEHNTDDVAMLKGMAQASFYIEDFNVAERCYRKLYELMPEDKNIALNYCVACIRNSHVDEGVNLLFKLQYENENDLNILRALAWGQMMQQRVADAELNYQKIMLKQDDLCSNDYLHYAYCEWFLGKIEDAITALKDFVHREGKQDKDISSFLKECWSNDIELLKKNGVSDIDMNIIVDLVRN